MTQRQKIQLFEDKKVRTAWDDQEEKWYLSIVDVCGVLTEQPDYDGAKNYWKVLKFRLKEEGNESVTKCNQLKMVSPKDGKRYNTDVADTEQLFRLIQSIPSKKAEPFKQWMAQVARERLDQMADPELAIDQAIQDWRRKGYSENWINNRVKSIEVRKALTDEWDRAGVQQGRQEITFTSHLSPFTPNVINKAKAACENVGQPISDHFIDVNKKVDLGSGAQREVDDVMLTRYACYLERDTNLSPVTASYVICSQKF